MLRRLLKSFSAGPLIKPWKEAQSSMQCRVAVFVGSGHPFELREYPVPELEPGAILVKIHMSNICGSDLHQWRGDGGSAVPKGGRILGHEMVGEVARLGAGVSTDSLGKPLREGDRIVYTYFYPCRRCWACTSGQFHLCAHKADNNLESADQWPHLNGGFAQYYYLRPGHFVFKVPDELSDEMVASSNCALSQVIHSLQQVDFGLGDTVVIQGAGGLGLYAVAVAREMGAGKIIAVDGIAQRLEMARAYGADETVSLVELPTPEARVERVRELTDGLGARVVMELVGLPAVVPEGIEMLRPGGSYVEIGMVSAKFSLEMFPSKFVRKNARYVGQNHYEPMALGQALEFLRRNRTRIPLDKIVSHRYPLDKIEEAFQQSEWFGRQPDKAAVTRAAIDPWM